MPPLEDGPGVDTAPLDGDVFLILDLPANSTVGCDARAINTGASGFKGIRDIPPGPHFVWVSEPDALSRCGYWFVTQGDSARVRVKQWDKYNEVLAEPASRFELRDHRDNVASLYPQLVSFRHGSDQAGPGGGGGDETQKLWRQLTSGISEGLLARVTRRGDASEWLVATSDTAQGEAGFPQTTQLYKAVAGPRELEFLFPEGDIDIAAAAARAERRGQLDTTTDDTERDADATGPPDTSSEVLRLVDTPGTGASEADVLGELQLTFLTGLHLTNLSCVDQWWHLVLKVVLRAHRLALLRPRLAADLIRTLHAQMVYDERYISGGGGGDGDPMDQGTSILDIAPGNKRKLRRALALYRRRLDELLLDLPKGSATADQGALGKAFGELEAWFWKFGWDLRTGGGDGVEEKKRRVRDGGGLIGCDDDDDDNDDDDYKPVIVDLDADGREVGLVSFS
jgi:A1 cistron-splicing factor AAR2